MRGSANVLAGHIRELVGVLTGSGDADGSRPIVVHVRHLVGETLHVIGRESEVVMYADKMRGSDGTLTHVLRDEEKVVVISFCDGVVHHRPRRGIVQSLRRFHEQLGINSLLDHDHGQLGPDR